MTRTYNERRNHQVIILVERRKLPPKEVAQRLHLTWSNVRKILSRFRKCHNLSQQNTVTNS